MTNTVNPLRIISFGGDANIFNRHVPGNIEVELRYTPRFTRPDRDAGEEVVIDVTVAGSALLALGRRAATNPSGTAVIGGSRRGGGIVAKVRRRNGYIV